MLNKVSEVVATLADRSFAESHVVEVDKGQGKTFSVIEWHSAVRMLDEVFTPFGWDCRIVGSFGDSNMGIYSRDIEVTGRATDDKTGEVVSLTRCGTGVGIVRGDPSRAESHDMAIHGAKSDGITNATKALGDGFGLYLYAKGKSGSSWGKSEGNGSKSNVTNMNDKKKSGPTDKQAEWLEKKGYSGEQIDSMTFEQAKACLDVAFGKSDAEAPIQPAGKAAKAPARKTQTRGNTAIAGDEDDDTEF